ncbi:MAG: hypothetical protein ACI83O_000750 [Patescibacteria group bacterium]|jgi:hypothetical protein
MNKNVNTLLLLLLTAIILGITVSFKNNLSFFLSIFAFILIVGANFITKKVVAYNFEADIEIKPWTLYQFGFRAREHFKQPIPMAWAPIVLTLVTQGKIWWLNILEFEVTSRPERSSKRHGLYKFTKMTENHVGLIAFFAILTNLIIGVISYTLGFEFFAKMNIYYATWLLLPISNLDGTKILFASRKLWTITSILAVGLTLIAFTI